MAGDEREALRRVAEQLCAALDPAAGESPDPGGRLSGELAATTFSGFLDPVEEELVTRVRSSLACVASSLGARMSEETTGRAVKAALDGSELAMRGELAMGRLARLPSLMPSFVFLVTLPLVSQDEALALSERTSRLLEEALGDGAD